MIPLKPTHPCERDLTCIQCGTLERVAEPQGQTIDAATYVGTCCVKYLEVDVDQLEEATAT